MAKKIAVISGGTSGIGKRLVTMFVKSGCKVVTFSRKKSNINLLKTLTLSILHNSFFTSDTFII